MSERSDELRRQLVRNVHDVKLERQTREPLYDTRCGGVSDGTVAAKLGAGYDELPAGKRSCPWRRCSSSSKVKAACAWPARWCR
jgi:hypothetical protein